jgi:hypothetical protein
VSDRRKRKQAERKDEPSPEEMREILKNLPLLRDMEHAEVLPLEEVGEKEDDDGL